MRSLRFLFITLVALNLAVSSKYCLAEEGTVLATVRAETKSDPKLAIGLVISSKGSEQFSDVRIARVNDSLIELQFNVPTKDLPSDAVATALIENEKGDLIFANVSPALNSDVSALLSIPECPNDDYSNLANQNQLGPLRSLVQVRQARSELALLKISGIMNEKLLSKLSKFEAAFGLSGVDELSPKLPPAELVNRLSRLYEAMREYKTFKGGSADKKAASAGQ